MKQLLLAVVFATCCFGYVQAQSFIQVLGVAQDGGYPHIGCRKNCCIPAWKNDTLRRYVVSFALVDPVAKKWWLFEATPDIGAQLQYFSQLTDGGYSYLPEGIFITHAHIGHYAGLMQLGREALGAKGVKVYALPRMQDYLEQNGPWSQLVKLQNIIIKPLNFNTITGLTGDVKVKAFKVPHRDEFSETAGFHISAGGKKYLFIPDIDKWNKWEKDITEEIAKVDVAMVDATFYNNEELPGRRMDEVPHPFVAETMQLFSSATRDIKAKVYFVHMNHTNPLLWNDEIRKGVEEKGYRIVQQGMKL